MTDALMILGGFALLAAGGETLVRGAVTTAVSFRVSPFIVAAVVVGFGSSMPELVTSINAGFAGSQGIAVGNIVGSNIANVLIVLGLAALIAPLSLADSHVRFDTKFVVAVSACFALLAATMPLTQSVGIALLTALAAYLALAVRREMGITVASESVAAPTTASALSGTNLTGASTGAPAMILGIVQAPSLEALPNSARPAIQPMALMLAGMVLLLIGGHFVVEGAIGVAASAGISQTVVGLTIVAVGTTLPEVVTAVVAAWRGHQDIAVGNVLGSCVFNLLAIGGVIAILTPAAVPTEIVGFHNLVMLAAASTLALLAYSAGRLGRLTGALFLAGYVTYLIALWP